MESKLDSYRKTKRRQALLNNFKDRIFNMVSFQQVRVDEKASHVIVVADEPKNTGETHNIPPVHKPVKKALQPCTSESSLDSRTTSSDEDDTVADGTSESTPRSMLTYITYLVYFLFWATLYAIAIELRFGAVFLMLSALIGICLNTRTKKTPGEVSAYSVFNENCEAIDGTLKAEQFEKEIGIRH